MTVETTHSHPSTIPKSSLFLFLSSWMAMLLLLDSRTTVGTLPNFNGDAWMSMSIWGFQKCPNGAWIQMESGRGLELERFFAQPRGFQSAMAVQHLCLLWHSTSDLYPRESTICREFAQSHCLCGQHDLQSTVSIYNILKPFLPKGNAHDWMTHCLDWQTCKNNKTNTTNDQGFTI